MRIFRLGAELQLSLYINVSALKMRKLIVVSLQRFVLDRKVTLRTIWTYEHHLRPLFMERHPGILPMSVGVKGCKCRRLTWSFCVLSGRGAIPQLSRTIHDLCLVLTVRTLTGSPIWNGDFKKCQCCVFPPTSHVGCK